MRVAVLGTGGMGRGAVRDLKSIPTVDGVVGYDIDARRLDEMRKECGSDIPGTTRLEEVLSDSRVKLVFITAPNA